MNNVPVKPSAKWFALPVLIIVIGAATFAFLLVSGLTGLTTGLTQVVVPGKADITLSEPGTYTIFHEYESAVGGKIYSTAGDISGLECKIVSKKTGTEIPLSQGSMSMTYDLGSRCGRSILECEVAAPGIYELSAQYPEGQSGPDVVLAIGRDFKSKLMVTILGGIGSIFGSFIAAGIITVLIVLKRQKTTKRLAEQAERLTTTS